MTKRKKVVFRKEIFNESIAILDLFMDGSRDSSKLDILKEFANRGPLSCPELVDLGYPEATAYRIVRVLVNRNLLVSVGELRTSKGGGPPTKIYSIPFRGQPN